MFVLPAPAEPSAFWNDVKVTEHFVLQQSVSTTGGAFLKSVLATIQNVLETKPPAYRIIYRHEALAISFILLAVGEDAAEIEEDWKWVTKNMMAVVSELDEVAERANFVVTKIRFLVSAEDGTQQDAAVDRKMRAATTTFRQTFAVGREERLVTYYSCALHSNFMLHQGWLYLSEAHMCFYSYMFGSEKKEMIALREIKDLARARSMGGARDDAIDVVAKDGRRLTFSNLFHRDETFEMLSQLTANTMRRVLLNSEFAQRQQQQQVRPHNNAVNPDTRLPAEEKQARIGVPLAEQIAQQRRNDEFRSEFGLPRSEELLAVIETAVLAVPGSTVAYRGRLYLSTSFVCYMSHNFRGCRVTMPLAAVRRIERAQTTDISGIHCYELTITVWHQMRIAFRVPLGGNACNHWCDALRAQLKIMIAEQQRAKGSETGMTRYTIKGFCKTCASESLLAAGEKVSAAEVPECLGRDFGFPNDSKTQKEIPKRQRWAKYMREYGRNLTTIRRAEFDRLIRVGLPNNLRGEIWELSSGAMYLRFQNRGVYDKYVSDYLERPGPCADEIEKDLTRSLPEYAGYQVEEGISALRRVLNAYSLRDAELGYCQAMNIVASTMLVFMSEEQVFWTLTVMCDRMVPGYYSPSMYGASLDQAIFQSLAEEAMPMLAASFKRNDIQLSIACLPWFLTLFINSMPLTYALRVLDCFFLEGPRILFQIGLAILKINGGALLDVTDDGTFLFILKEYYRTLGEPAYPDATNARAREVTKFHELLYVAYNDFPAITHARIEELRRSHQLRIVHSVEDFSKRTFLRSVIDASGFTREQLSLLYDRYYAVLFSTRKGSENGSAVLKNAEGNGANLNDGVTLDIYGFARFMFEISSWMRVQIQEARERAQSHRSVGNKSADHLAREVAAGLENPGWFIGSLFRYTAAIVPPRSRVGLQDTDADAASAVSNDLAASSEASPSQETPQLPSSADSNGSAESDQQRVGGLRVSFQQCVIALGRIVNTDLLTRMDVFFDMYATAPEKIGRQEMFQLSEAILYIGHGEDVETGTRSEQPDGITNEESLLRSVSGFLQRAVKYSEAADSELGRGMFRMAVLEDEMLERFFADIVPVSFRFTDGVELANPKRAISTGLPSSPLTARSAESASARLLAGGRLMAEGMSARVAQTIALGSRFVDGRALTPVVRSAAELTPAPSERAQSSPEPHTMTAMSALADGPDDEIAEHMVQLSLRADPNEAEADAKAASGSPESSSQPEHQEHRWVNAPQEPPVNAPADPYENLLDEVDQLLGEMKDDDDPAHTAAAPASNQSSDLPADDSKPSTSTRRRSDLNLQMDDDDEDLARLLKD
ncbi:GTPase activating protein (GAP) [Coemansia guatemalensis]|uniref:GTPase activating protein (GAP) n=1 Tax=Coemansia guatemalensis TaxID=2761395 RepID=A0A9W8I103_9FUNG|nr:GTPase activating protein (GAP) [Coemansia guatemalensis]